MNSRPTVLFVDDDETILKLLNLIFKGSDLRTLSARNGRDAIDLLQKEVIDVMLLDQMLPEKSGIDLLKLIKTIDPNVVVIILTGYGSIKDAVDAIRQGAYQYITKPFDPKEIEVLVNKALLERALLDEVKYLRSQVKETFNFKGFVGKSVSVRQILELVRMVAPTDSAVLLHGESGTGKELLAKIIHQESRRASRKFIAVNCGALAESLLESSLFGFQKGAFTGAVKTTRGYFEEVEGGTLFLDEITETSPKFQSSLLRVLQEKEFSRLGATDRIKVDFRLISATNRDLQEEVKNGSFREDLYYRINVMPIHIPSLRERREDIPVLACYLLKNINARMERKISGFSQEAMTLLESAELRGNVRELQNIIERAAILRAEGLITAEDLPEYIRCGKMEDDCSFQPYKKAKENFEKKYIKKLLEKTDGNVAEASKLSEIKRQNIYEKMKKYGLK